VDEHSLTDAEPRYNVSIRSIHCIDTINMMTKRPIETSVLVAGGSLVGLSAGLFLAARGVPTIVVEPHLGSHPHPRAIGYTPRTLELFRTVGIADRIPQAPPGFRLTRVKADSLAGVWQPPTEWTPAEKVAADADPARFSPYRGAAIAQDKLEPILRDRARELGAHLELGAEVVTFAQDATGVTTTIRDRATGATREIRSAYLIAADGATSRIRETLGIARSGRGHIRTVRSVLFRADLETYLARGVHQFEIEQPEMTAFLTSYGDGRWVLMFLDDRERTDDETAAAIARAIGRSDVEFEILAAGRWELAALIADRFAMGRVFLAGDAAHVLPPTRGGFGANTGIHDAYDLAWKLAAVLAGESTPRLLDTYDAERRPVAWERLRQTFARPDYAKEAAGIADGVELFDDVAMELGQLYRSTAVAGVGAELPAAARPDAWRGQPGTRAPHVPKGNGSTLDLFGASWVLVVGDSTAGWNTPAARVSAALGIPIVLASIDAAARDAFGLAANGASLVRPDGVIAWRASSAPANPESSLGVALATVASAARA
jgi:2-polyprenyl-6-methoxyphenol hydroxylase-like FAD-dependent oxidoreductase